MAGENGSAEPRKGRSRLRTGAVLATVATLVGIATGVLTLRDQLFPSDDVKDGPPGQTTAQEPGIPSFEKPVGHFAEARPVLAFLKRNDREAVFLDINFPDLGTGPGGGDNVESQTEPFKGGTRYLVTSVTLITNCFEEIPAGETNPTPSDGCQGTSLRIGGPETEDSQTSFQHGVPKIKGYFIVDDTGFMQMGITTIILRPVTFDEAKVRNE
jgi:hypothetical protein